MTVSPPTVQPSRPAPATRPTDSTLVSILKALGAQGTLAVCGARGPVLSLFQLTRMDKVFSIDADRAAALARVGA